VGVARVRKAWQNKNKIIAYTLCVPANAVFGFKISQREVTHRKFPRRKKMESLLRNFFGEVFSQ
jgi:hypothetical protein